MDPDVTLVFRFLQGDSTAFDRLLERYKHRVYRFALKVTHHDDDAEDLAQEILIEVYRSLRGINAPGKFPQWLTTIARRVVYRWTRGLKTYSSCSGVKQPGGWTVQETGSFTLIDSSEEPSTTPELRNRVASAIQTLSEKCRQVIVLHYLEGYHLEDISRLLHLPIGTVKSRLYQARHHLKEEITRMDTPVTTRRTQPDWQPRSIRSALGSWQRVGGQYLSSLNRSLIH